MPRTASVFAAIVSPTIQVASAATFIPTLGAVGDLLSVIITLCDSVPQNRHVTTLNCIFFKLTLPSTGMQHAYWLKDVSTCGCL